MGQDHILVVDDDESFLRMIARILQLEGYRVETARTGKEAIEKSNSNTYNLVVVDLRLPDMNGSDLLNAMRKTTARMIKIMLTGFELAGDEAEEVRKNADGYLVKPVEIDDLLGTIKKHLGK